MKNQLLKRNIFIVLTAWCDVSCDEEYRSICEVLTNKYCIGMIGGSGNQAYYIYGSLGNSFLILDPHDVNVSKKV